MVVSPWGQLHEESLESRALVGYVQGSEVLSCEILSNLEKGAWRCGWNEKKKWKSYC